MDIQLLNQRKQFMIDGDTKCDEILRRLNDKLANIGRLFTEQVESGIRTLVLRAIQNAVNKLSLDFNTDRSNYLEELLDEILSLWMGSEIPMDEQIEEVLWNHNFNSRPFFLFIIDRISNHVKNEETIIGKMELLAFELKRVNQVVCDRSVRFTEKYPSLQDVINNWLLEEMNFLRTKQELAAKYALRETATNDFKVALDLSVAQFSCLVRGLIEKKLILNTNLTELATFLSSAVVTKRSENISEGSFRRKYYNIEDSTKKSVIEVLNKTIDWLMKS